jgi:hypothetical protein
VQMMVPYRLAIVNLSGVVCESLPVHTHSRIALELIVDPDAGCGDDGLVGLG